MRSQKHDGTVIAWLVALTLMAGCGSSGKSNRDGGGATGGSGGGAGDATGGSGPIDSGGEATGGSDAGTCDICFVRGRWQIDNLSPCFVSSASTDGGAATLSAAVSTQISAGISQCPSDPTVKPTAPWSTDTLTTDCPGHYHLCITLKAGVAQTPAADDCTMIQDCADGDYAVGNQPQTWAALPGWLVDPANLACAEKFRDQGGYAVLTATGTASNCGAVTKTLATIAYCPLSCQTNPTSAGCANCMSGGTGTF